MFFCKNASFDIKTLWFLLGMIGVCGSHTPSWATYGDPNTEMLEAIASLEKTKKDSEESESTAHQKNNTARKKDPHASHASEPSKSSQEALKVSQKPALDEESEDEDDLARTLEEVDQEDTEEGGQVFAEYKDPLAPLNKFVFGFNKVTDILIVKPLSITYKTVVPSFLRTGVHNVLNNLKEPLNFFNAVLQGDGEKAGRSLGRFIANTIFGIAGLFDVATPAGIKHEPNDFGITLAKWGFGEGFYLVLPILGPSNLRDSFGKVGDFFMDPFNIYVYATDRNTWGYVRLGATVIDTRTQVMDVTDSLDKSSDPYNTYRVTFSDNRRYIVEDHKKNKNLTSPNPFNRNKEGEKERKEKGKDNDPATPDPKDVLNAHDPDDADDAEDTHGM